MVTRAIERNNREASFPLLDLIDSYQQPSEEQIETSIDLLGAHPLRILRPFLRDWGIRADEHKAAVMAKLRESVRAGRIRAVDVISVLDQIEGWGDQHIYLYRAPSEAAERWSSDRHARSALAAHGLEDLFNRRNPAVFPKQLHLSSVRCSRDRVAFQWIDRRVIRVPLPEQNHEDEELIIAMFRKIVTRGVITFDWDVATGDAALLIQRLPAGTDYSTVKSRIERELQPIVPISTFTRVRLGRGVADIEESGEARRRQYKHETERGSVASFTSSSRSRDAFEDPALRNARNALGSSTVPLLGNFYWNPVPGRLEREIHVKVYPKDRRVGIFGACTESEVRYLLSRIRNYCS